LFARATSVTSVVQATVCTGEIYNSTDASILDTQGILSEYVSGTQNAYLALINTVVATFAGTRTIIARYKVDDATGMSNVEDIKLIAIPVGV